MASSPLGNMLALKNINTLGVLVLVCPVNLLWDTVVLPMLWPPLMPLTNHWTVWQMLCQSVADVVPLELLVIVMLYDR